MAKETTTQVFGVTNTVRNLKQFEFSDLTPYVNCGISGQVTSQMLVRIYPDVIDLKRNMIQENIIGMTKLASTMEFRSCCVRFCR